MKKILFIANHRLNRSPSQRFRFEQYLSFLESNGIRCHFSYLLSAEDDSHFYSSGQIPLKTIILCKAFIKRFSDVFFSFKYGTIFIQREAFITGTIFFERLWKFLGKKIIFDFDDSIWLLDMSDGNKKYGWLKDPAKTARIIKLSSLVIAGNSYLEDYALRFNANTVVFPTTINTEEYKPSPRQNSGKVCIGWSGSITTIKHFDFAIPILKKIKEKYGEKVVFKVIGDKDYYNADLSIRGLKWIQEKEVEELCSFDIGIMPLPDDEWAKGKCGLKGLQYMALGIATVMSPVGVNTDIISDGVNGFLAKTNDEWVQKLSLLVESPELREQLGLAGKQTIKDKYSVESQKASYLEIFTSLTED